MRSIIATSALALAIAVPGLAAAQELKFSGGATLATKYIADGIEQTKGAAIQPWIEGEIAGFYFGAWLSNVDKALLGGDSVETDLYLGYRGEAGMFGYDIGYTHYYYNKSGSCCGQIIGSVSIAPTDALSMGVRVAYDPDAKVTNSRLTAGYAFGEKFAVEALYGKINKGGHAYYAVSGSYALTDSLGLSLTLSDTDRAGVDDKQVVLALDYSFSFN